MGHRVEPFHPTEGPDVYKCGRCTFESPYRASLKDHTRIVHEMGEENVKLGRGLFEDFPEFQCVMCHNSSHSILSHIFHCDTSKCSEETFQHCSHKSGVKSSLKETVKEIIKYAHCNRCSFKCVDDSNLKRHVLSKHTSRSRVEWFKCNFCSSKTKNQAYLRQHIVLKHTSKEDTKWFSCGHCPCSFQLRELLRQHMLQHVPKDLKWFKCTHCSYVTKTQRFLKGHILVQHTDRDDTKWFLCRHCSRKFRIENSLKMHVLQTHMADEEMEWFNCTECSFKCYKEKRLKRHFSCEHTPQTDRWFQCYFCPKIVNRARYQRHVFLRHTPREDILSFPCEYCSHKFRVREMLRQHMLRHVAGKPTWWRCDNCAYITKTRRHLKAHVIVEHADRDALQCAQC